MRFIIILALLMQACLLPRKTVYVETFRWATLGERCAVGISNQDGMREGDVKQLVDTLDAAFEVYREHYGEPYCPHETRIWFLPKKEYNIFSRYHFRKTVESPGKDKPAYLYKASRIYIKAPRPWFGYFNPASINTEKKVLHEMYHLWSLSEDHDEADRFVNRVPL